MTADGTGSEGTKQDYSGGTGTLADGIIGTSTAETHLFHISIATVIEFFFDAPALLTGLDIYGGDFPNNTIPGALTGFDIAAGGVTHSITTTQFGGIAANGQAYNDRADLTGLFAAPVASVQLFNFTTAGSYYSITEAKFFSESAAVPLPAGLPLLLAGLGSLAVLRRRARG